MKNILFFLILIYSSSCFSQTFIGASSFGGSGLGIENSLGTARDLNGNIFVVGLLGAGSVTFGSTTITQSGGNSDGYLAKYDANGNPAWIKKFGGPDDDVAIAVATDAAGYIYVTGNFSGISFDVNPDPSATQILANQTNILTRDCFIAKLDPNGNLVWAKQVSNTITGALQEDPSTIKVDAAGNVFVAGRFSQADFDTSPTGTLLESSQGGTGAFDGFLLKLDPSGNTQWVRKYGGNTSNDQVTGMDIDAAGNVFITGPYRGTVAAPANFNSLAPGTATAVSNGTGNNNDYFVVKVTNSGNYVFHKTLGGTGADTPNTLVVGPDGNLYIGGSISTTVDVNPGVGVVNVTSAGSSDALLLKLTNGGEYIAHYNFGGTGFDQALGIAFDCDYVYLTGDFTSTVDFNNSTPVNSSTSAGDADIFVLRLYNSLNYVSHNTIGGAQRESLPWVEVDQDIVYLIGSFRTMIDADPSAGNFPLSNGGGPINNSDVFYTRWSYAQNSPVTITKTAGAVQYNACANPDEVITELTIKMVNTSGNPLNNVFLEETISTSFGSFLGLVEYIGDIESNATIVPQPNPQWNGTTITSLFTNNSGAMGVGQEIVVKLKLKFNAAALSTSCITNTTYGGGTWMNMTFTNLASSCNYDCVGNPFSVVATNPTALTTNVCGNYEAEIQHWLAIYGGATFNHQGRVVEVICNDYCEPHGWIYADNCSKNATLPVAFTVKYTDGSTLTYCSTINLVDPQIVEFVELPESITIDCSNTSPAAAVQAWLNANGGALGKLCGGYLYYSNDYNGTLPTACGAGKPVTFTITNECGLFTSAVAMVSVTDNGAPTFTSVPASITVACDAATPALGTATATDACSGATVTFSDVTSGTVCTGITTTRIFIASDACGNTSTSIQSVTKAADTAAPTFTFVPANSSVACGGTPVLGSATATDACSSVTVTFVDSGGGDNCGAVPSIREFTATDGCGNTATAMQIVTPEGDSVRPVFIFVPEQVEILCGEAVVYGEVEAEDNCGAVTITYEDTVSGNTCDGIMNIRTWTATDNCDNSRTAKQIVWQLPDSVRPVKEFEPEDTEIMCGDDIVFGTPVFTDGCGSVTVTYEDMAMGDACAGIMNIRTWTATDGCDNSRTAKQVVWQLGDVVDPEFTNMFDDDYMLHCGDTPDFSTVGAVDNCGGSVDVTYEVNGNTNFCQIVNGIEYGYDEEVNWTATDACGNEAHETTYIWYLPQGSIGFLGKPTDKTVSCSEGYIFDQTPPMAKSFYGEIISVTQEDIANITACGSGTVTRRWTATDEMGNTAIAEQMVTILPDTELPSLVLNNNSLVVNCASEITVVQPTVTDNCAADNAIFVTYTDVAVENTVERTWSAQDACGNVANATQIYIILDTQAPVFTSALQNKTISCDATVVFDNAIALDACSEVTMSHTDTQNAINCGVEHTRTWVATDALGHVSTAEQKITVLDNTAPIFSFVPASEVVASANEMNFGTPIVTDNCQNVLLSYTDQQTAPICGNSGYTATRTWVANDGCSNQVVATQQISIALDAEAPVFSSTPEDKAVGFGEAIVFDVLTATDNNGTATITFADVQGAPICGNSGYSVTRVWKAVDACNNNVLATQVITVGQDVEAPAFGTVLTNKTIDCGGLMEFDSPEVTDNSGTFEMTYSDVQSTPTCGNSGYTMTRTYAATDACNNAAQMVQTITVAEDTQAPEFIGSIYDLDMTLAAYNAWVPVAPAAADNCQAMATIISPAINVDGCNYKVDYTATDACGNFVIRTQNVHIVDCLILGTNEGVLSSVSIYPNPVLSELTLVLSSEVNLQDVTAQVFDMMGKQVSMTQVAQHQSDINVHTLVAGTYILRLATEGAVKTVKFVKM